MSRVRASSASTDDGQLGVHQGPVGVVSGQRRQLRNPRRPSPVGRAGAAEETFFTVLSQSAPFVIRLKLDSYQFLIPILFPLLYPPMP